MTTHQHGHEPQGAAQPLLPEALTALTAAARRHGAARRRWRPWHGAAIGLTVVAVSGTAVAAKGGWQGLFGPADQHHATIATEPVPADQVAALGVLRRPQRESDRSRIVKLVIHRVFRHSMGEDDVHLDGVRLLEQHERDLTLLIPVGRIGPPEGMKVRAGTKPYPTQRNQLCLAQATTASLILAPPPPGESQTTPRYRKGRLLTDPTLDENEIEVSSSCGSLLDIRRGRLGGSNPFTGEVIGLRTDGIVAVQVTSRRGETVRAPVHDNLFHLTIPQDRPGFRGAPVRGVTADGRLR
jgi:hypothetical protein